MKLRDSENIVKVAGHKGPHPERYHDYVFVRLTEALGDCRQISTCRNLLTNELRKLAKEVQTPGTKLNRLVTQ
jgi:hypothetical protein